MPQIIRVRSKETGNEFDIDAINLNDTLVQLDKDVPVVPAGEPDESWTVDQLRAFADADFAINHAERTNFNIGCQFGRRSDDGGGVNVGHNLAMGKGIFFSLWHISAARAAVSDRYPMRSFALS